MKKAHKDDDILNFSPGELQIRASETISLSIPVDTIRSLERVAASRDMSVDALLKFYIGQCLRQDLDKLFGEEVLTATADVLKKHFASDEEVVAIVESIRDELAHAA
ncbi:MAG: hypothetical protein KF753_16460 [Caldilineaceae bacterium]|nr:hypothetical protein [Caldilineaceae bacterium]